MLPAADWPKRYPWGDEITHDDANYWKLGSRDVWSRASPVGSFPPNSYGLYDMAGNVWEWCMDKWNADFYSRSPRENPVSGGLISFVNNHFRNVASNRVVRGGSWSYHPFFLRVAYRFMFDPGFTDVNYGFRCAASITPKFLNSFTLAHRFSWGRWGIKPRSVGSPMRPQMKLRVEPLLTPAHAKAREGIYIFWYNSL